MSSLYRNFLSGVVDNTPLLVGGTTLNSTGLASMPAVVAPDVMWLALDPSGSAGTPELVQVTAHTALATSCTIVRGQQTSLGGGAARQHLQNTVWAHVYSASEFLLTPQNGALATSEATTSTSYVDLATVGPVLTLTTGRLVRVTAAADGSATASDSALMGFAVSGASSIAAGTPALSGIPTATYITTSPATNALSVLIAVTAGTNTFTLKYKGTDGGGGGVTATFANRLLIVERLD